MFRRKLGTYNLVTLLLVAMAPSASPQAPVQDRADIQVDAAKRLEPLKPIWSYFGYDEPNYTYAPNGIKLLNELGALGEHRVYIRTHNLLTTGDGTPALKWGSTNAYTEDANGNPVYDWTIVDRIVRHLRSRKTQALHGDWFYA